MERFVGIVIFLIGCMALGVIMPRGFGSDFWIWMACFIVANVGLDVGWQFIWGD